ncbi:MAG TPA: EamA family transporter [Gemmatimonadales bacterium]|nr:EamA family transporter [Gemmatimonadales bacterium]
MTRRQADLLLVFTCAIWGLSFPTVKVALADASPLAFVAIRFMLGALILLPGTRLRPLPSRGEWLAGLLLGALLGVGFATQAVGLAYTTASRSAFIVALSSVLAPLVAFVVVRERLSWWTVAALGLATAGIYFLTDPGAGGLNRGDWWTLITALVFGAQIVAVHELGLRFEIRRLVFIEIVVVAIGVGVAAPLLEPVRFAVTTRSVLALAYCGVAATAVALLLQMRAQKDLSSGRAALLFCTEPVFASLASWLWLGERLSLTQWVGGAMIVVGMLVAEPKEAVSHQASAVS